MKRIIEQAVEAKMRRDECTLRTLLGLWVSELEPSVVYRDGEIIGLTAAGMPLGSYPPIFNPLASQ